MNSILKSAKIFIKKEFSGKGTGHDYFYAERVVNTSLEITHK